MEDEALEELANLIDAADDDFDSDDEFIAQLYKNDEQCVKMPSQGAQDENNTSVDGDMTETLQENNISPEMSKKMTDMQKYIKFLEAQLKTQNEEKKKSPEKKEKSPVEKCESASSTKKFYNQSTPTRSAKKENSNNQKLSENAARTKSQNSREAFAKKPRVAHTPKIERKSSGRKRKAEEPAPQSSAAKKPAQDDSNSITDGYSGLKIVNPLISSAVMERRMEGRKLIKISSIQSKIHNNDIEGDWVTIGVLIQKMPGKTTSKGDAYSLWKISDLAFHLSTSIVSLFLFGENHKEHWKTVEGSVIALLNPSILPPREKKSSDVGLSLDNPKKLMVVGTSQEFGVCQSTRKSDGARCSSFVNKSQGNYCSYHVCREYSKKRAKRMGCQQGYGAPSKLPRSKLNQKVAAESFFYQDSFVSAYSSPEPRREKVTLKNLNGSSSTGKNQTGSSSARKDYLNSWKDKQSEKKSSEESSGNKEGPSEDFLVLLNIPSAGSRNLKFHLHKEEDKEVNETRPAVVSASEFLKANKVERKSEQEATSSVPRVRTQPTSEARSSKDPPHPRTPMLGRGLNCDDDIIFDENVPLNFRRKTSSTSDRAKERALAIVRQTGPITPKDPNVVRAKKPSSKQQNAIKSKLESDEEQVSNIGKTFSLADGFSLDSEEGRRILKAKSRHIGEVRQAEIQQEQAYFTSREKKEEMEAKMLSVKELKVKAVHCPQCKYVAESPSSVCKEENHNLKYLNVMKKFFSCRECRERTVVYGQRFPTHECKKCGAKNYEKCSVWKEKSGPKIGGETLLLRGPEYAKFLNSLQTTKMNGVLPKYL